jgi:hypothetical protein
MRQHRPRYSGWDRTHAYDQEKTNGREAGDEDRTAAELFYALAASFPHSQGPLPLHDLLRITGDITFQ